MIAATDAKRYIFVDPYHTGRTFYIRGYSMGGGDFYQSVHLLQCFQYNTYLCNFRDDRSLYDNCLLSDSRIDNGYGRYNNDLESRYNWAVYRINPGCNGGGGYGKFFGLSLA